MTGVQTCALPISCGGGGAPRDSAGSGATEEGLTSRGSLNNFLVALTKLMLSIFEGAYSENTARAGYMSKKILGADSREEIISIFKEAFEEVIQSNLKKDQNKKEEDSLNLKTDRIVDAVKMIIDNSYDNSFLCVAAIADEMKLSAGYIGKLFYLCALFIGNCNQSV